MAEVLSTSVDEICRQVLPPGSVLLAGEGRLSREVTWASTIRVRPPAFPKLAQGEMALLSSDWLDLIDPPLRLAQVLDGLAERGASAVAVLGVVSDDAVRKASDLGMPLVQLPDGANLYELEGAIARFISSQRTLLHQRSGEIYRRLMEASIQGKGMPGLLRVLALATGNAAALLDQRFRPRHLAAPPGMGLTLNDLGPALAEAGAAQMETLPQALDRPEPPVLDVPISLPDFQAIGCAVALQEQVAGYLLLAGRSGDMGPVARLALSQASSVFASEMAKEKAVVEAESRLKGDFLEELLEGDLEEDEEEMASRASYLGYDLSGANVAVVMDLEPGPRLASGPHEAPEALTRRLFQILPPGNAAMARGSELVLLLPFSEEKEKSDLIGKAEALRQQLSRGLGDVNVNAGVGRYHAGLRGLRRSYQEARRALVLGRELNPGSKTHFFGSLGVYPVLMPLAGTPEAEAFLEEALGFLLDYDHRNNSELVQTLEAYFSHQENLARTAEALHLHRNSLAYRLRRIQEVSNVSLDDAEARFRLQLALKLRRLHST
ncbi:MAG: helix-turn-helix domain-containing protein [Dehalococcoidia bacterium]|nr:helix-turn-helix domain-containing protein [Dehalococcoidia bacterium]